MPRRTLPSWSNWRAATGRTALNIWTQGLDNRKRPVMVWLHGGGFSTGSGHEMKAYDGENPARRGDVVVVSLNHRVGAAGFLNLASVGGEKSGDLMEIVGGLSPGDHVIVTDMSAWSAHERVQLK